MRALTVAKIFTHTRVHGTSDPQRMPQLLSSTGGCSTAETFHEPIADSKLKITHARALVSVLLPTTFDTELRQRTNSSDLTADLTWLHNPQIVHALLLCSNQPPLSMSLLASTRRGEMGHSEKSKAAKNGKNQCTHYQNCERPKEQPASRHCSVFAIAIGKQTSEKPGSKTLRSHRCMHVV